MERKTGKCEAFQSIWKQMLFKREDGKIRKFVSLVDKGILVGYSSKRKAYKCFSPRLNIIMESINVMIDDKNEQKTKEGRKHS
jgi:hypothetical protein